MGIGLNGLPADICNSTILTTAQLEQLAGVTALPVINATFEDDTLKNIIQYYSIDPFEMEKELHYYAQELLIQNKVNEAWQVLLALN